MPKERTLTENVSPHGARVLMEREWRPGQQVMVISPKEGIRARGQIVYWSRWRKAIAVGLELSSGWSRGPSLTSAVPTILAERKIHIRAVSRKDTVTRLGRKS